MHRFAILLTVVMMAGCARIERSLKPAYLSDDQGIAEVWVYSESMPQVTPGSFFVECLTMYESEIKRNRREDQVVRVLEHLGWKRTLNPKQADYIIGWRTVEGSYSEKVDVISRPVTGIAYDKYLGFYRTYLGNRVDTERSVTFTYGMTIVGHGGPVEARDEKFYLNTVTVAGNFSPESYMPVVMLAAMRNIGNSCPQGAVTTISDNDSLIRSLWGLSPRRPISNLIVDEVAKAGLVKLDGLDGQALTDVKSELRKIGVAVVDDSTAPTLSFSLDAKGSVTVSLLVDGTIRRTHQHAARVIIGGYDSGDPYLIDLAEILLKE